MYPYRLVPEYCVGFTTEETVTIENTKPIVAIQPNTTTFTTDKQRWQYYRSIPATIVNLCSVPFQSNYSIVIKQKWASGTTERTWVTHNFYWKVSSDGINWSNAYSMTIPLYVNSTYTVWYRALNWNESNVNYVRMWTTNNASWAEGPSSGCNGCIGVRDEWRWALEGNLASILGGGENPGSYYPNLYAFAFRGLFRAASAADPLVESAGTGLWPSLMHAHNAVFDHGTHSGRQCYTYMFSNQSNLLTAPLYWDVTRQYTYSTSYNQVFRGMFQDCTNLLTGLRGFSNYAGDAYYLYQNCTNLRAVFAFSQFSTSQSYSFQNVPTDKYWNTSPSKSRGIYRVENGVNSSWPNTNFLTNWNMYTGASTTSEPRCWNVNPNSTTVFSTQPTVPSYAMPAY